jgi:hypothetical protein
MQPTYTNFAALPEIFGVGIAEVQAKRQEFEQRLGALPAELQPYVLAMYANPVIRKAELQRA